MNPLDGKNSFSYSENNKKFDISNSELLMANNLFIKRTDVDWYSKCNRFGWIDPFNNDRVTKEYLFFTKPDLNLFTSSTPSAAYLDDNIKRNPIIYEAAERMPYTVAQLESSVKHPDGNYGSFMFLLSNAVSSKLDLPGISADSQESTKNIMGSVISYRGHSLKSDNGYDFTLSFKDTAYLEIYTLAKVYDEWERMVKQGIAAPKKMYIENHTLSDQFSIYKFLIGSDGETILYYAKLTGCYFSDVPRTDLGDPSDEGFKYSLSFHAQFVEDMNPYILSEFTHVSKFGNPSKGYLPIYNSEVIVNNQWGRYPKIVKVYKDNDKRVERRGVEYDYRLKWCNN